MILKFNQFCVRNRVSFSVWTRLFWTSISASGGNPDVVIIERKQPVMTRNGSPRQHRKGPSSGHKRHFAGLASGLRLKDLRRSGSMDSCPVEPLKFADKTRSGGAGMQAMLKLPVLWPPPNQNNRSAETSASFPFFANDSTARRSVAVRVEADLRMDDYRWV